MRTTDISPVLTRLFAELVDGASDPTGAFILNSRDVGLLRSLDTLSADERLARSTTARRLPRMRSTCATGFR